MNERWEHTMIRLNVLALFPEFALAFSSDFIRPSHVNVGPDSQRNIIPPTKPAAASFGKGSHRIEVSSIGCAALARSSDSAGHVFFASEPRGSEILNVHRTDDERGHDRSPEARAGIFNSG